MRSPKLGLPLDLRLVGPRPIRHVSPYECDLFLQPGVRRELGLRHGHGFGALGGGDRAGPGGLPTARATQDQRHGRVRAALGALR